MKRILVVTAVEAERDAVLRGIGANSQIDVIAGGVGPAASAASTAAALVSSHYDLVISAGIGGGFADRAAIGSIVIADRIIAADLGAETEDGFLSIDTLGFGSGIEAVAQPIAQRWTDTLRQNGLPCCLGAVLTVSTVTGTAARAAQLQQRIPQVAAEAMEGYGVAVAARQADVPVLEVRAISNAVGPRNRDLWRIPDALHALERACAVIQEVVLE